MKTLVELRTEIELGMTVYPTTNHDADVRYAEGWYIFGRSSATPVECESAPGWSHGERVTIGGDYENGEFVGGGIIFDDCYRTFEALLADWPNITSQPVWSPTKTFERRLWEKRQAEEYKQRMAEQEAGSDPQSMSHQGIAERMQSWGLEHKEITLDTSFAELGIRSEEFPSAQTLNELLEATQKKAQAQEKYADESIVPLDSQLGRDVARLVEQYFPGIVVTSIQSSYHRGVFIGDFSINLDVKLDHQMIQQVGISFTHGDVPGRPSTWEELLTLPDILLYINSITLKNCITLQEDILPPSVHITQESIAYTSHSPYREEIEQWIRKHGEGLLYTSHEGKNVFIIATEGIERETLEAMERLSESAIPTQE